MTNQQQTSFNIFLDTSTSNIVFLFLYFSGKLGRYLGEFENTEKGHRTQVFVMYVESLDPEEQWEESIRERRWFTLQEAKEVLRKNKPNHVKYIDKMIQTRTITSATTNENL